MTTDRFKDGVQWWMDTTKPMSMALCPNPPQWHIDACKLVRLVPQRPWVGLTEVDILAESKHWKNPEDFMAGVDWAETKLKEKNT